MADNAGTKFAYFLVGMGIGAAVGLLFAPRSGRETREYLRERAEEGKEYVSKKAHELRKGAEEYVEKGKEAVAQQKETVAAAVEAGKQAYRQEKRKA